MEKAPKGGEMIGNSLAFLEARRLIDRTACFEAAVLIEGETGTGKELAARAIHYQGHRRDKPFVAINCGAVPDSLIENELFGHQRGAYTDARTDQPGLVKLAYRGTLFLDEIDALSPKGQLTLLRFLQDQEYRPLGAPAPLVADVRIIAASNRNLLKLAQTGEFRLDLLYRVKLMYLELPPLRARIGDPELLALHFLRTASERFRLPEKRIHPSTLAWFDRYTWPGNVRELENLIFREVLLSDADELRIDPPTEECPTLRAGGRIQPDCRDRFHRAKIKAIEEFERNYLSQIMAQACGNVSMAARLAGKERRALGRLLKKHGIDRRDYRS
jgi:two-component system response regulator GlrR